MFGEIIFFTKYEHNSTENRVAENVNSCETIKSPKCLITWLKKKIDRLGAYKKTGKNKQEERESNEAVNI